MNTDSSYEVQASNEAVITAKPTNTLGVVALVLAIIGLLLTISLVGIFLGVPLLVVALILGLIAVCKPPRGKAVASLIIAVISLGVVTYASFWIVGILIPPVKSFIARTTEESQTNTEFRLVVKQPGFEKFLQDRMEKRLENADRITVSTEGSLKEIFTRYVDFSLAEVKAEMLDAVNAWVATYGLPAPQTEIGGSEEERLEWQDDTLNREDIDILVEERTDENVVIQDVESILNALEE